MTDETIVHLIDSVWWLGVFYIAGWTLRGLFALAAIGANNPRRTITRP